MFHKSSFLTWETLRVRCSMIQVFTFSNRRTTCNKYWKILILKKHRITLLTFDSSLLSHSITKLAASPSQSPNNNNIFYKISPTHQQKPYKFSFHIFSNYFVKCSLSLPLVIGNTRLDIKRNLDLLETTTVNVTLANKKPHFVIKGLKTFCLFRSFPWMDEALWVSTSCAIVLKIMKISFFL